MYQTKIKDKQKFCDDFAKEVKKNKYQPLEYKAWRELVKKKTSPELEICSNDGQFIIIKNEGKNILELKSTDGSIGQYISENYINQSLFNAYSSGPLVTLDTTSPFVAFNTNDAISDTCTCTCPSIEDIREYYSKINKVNDSTTVNKENKKVNTDNMFNFEFGPVSSEYYRLSPYGIAVNTSRNGWVSYNAKTQEVFNVDVINFDASKIIYKMPVALSAIAAGDILMHCGKPVFVREVHLDRGIVSAVDFTNSTLVDILPVKSPFGFNFFTKVCSLVDFTNAASANTDNPFGNLLPFMLMGEKDNFDPMMLMFMGQNGNFNMDTNTMMMMMVMAQKDKNDLLPLLWLMNSKNTNDKPVG
jgi:hypothetical protein